MNVQTDTGKAGEQFPADYVERVYAGWLGKVIGVRHGGNVEGWTYEQIKLAFGEVSGYLHTFKNFAADDDTNGTFTFLRALDDFTHTRNITPEQMGLNLLNYAPDGHGFFWWGGYGNSTEHTAYLNLKHGISAPRSGSIEQNGITVAEQIGGQIFADGWGLVAPGNPALAAEYAKKMASVTHDGNGVYGAMFVAACIAQSFVETDMKTVIFAGLSVIPANSEYARVTNSVIDYYDNNRESSWRDCFRFVQDNFGYDRYPGNCHIIPNSAVIVLSLLYGKGDFNDSINICNMCGWDTDCNVANVGTILGVRNGLDGIDYSWREPINDFLCLSTVLGGLNIMDLPTCASYIARFGYMIADLEFPEKWSSILSGTSPRFHFTYPRSTHAFRLDTDSKQQVTAKLGNNGDNTLKVVFDRSNGGHGYRVYYQTYYRPEDFNDSRYDPSFSPVIYPGQSISTRVKIAHSTPARVEARVYVLERNTNTRHYGQRVSLDPEEWTVLNYDIPQMNNACLMHAGIEFVPLDGRKPVDEKPLVAYIDFFDFGGPVDYSIDFSGERLEVWNNLHIEVSQLSRARGIWTLEDGDLSGSYYGEPAEAYTGDVTWRDYAYEATVIPHLGDYHNIQFRVQGVVRSYAFGFGPDNRAVLYKNVHEYQILRSEHFEWRHQQAYTMRVEAVLNHFKLFVDGQLILEYTDENHPYLNGQVGFSNLEASHTHYKGFQVQTLS